MCRNFYYRAQRTLPRRSIGRSTQQRSGSAPRSVLIIRLGALGDVINTLPSLALLRQKLPSCYIAWLVEDTSADILRAIPILDEVIVFPRSRWQNVITSLSLTNGTITEGIDFFRSVPCRHFEVVLDYQANFKSGFFSFLTGARRRLGFSWHDSRELNWLFNNLRVRLPGARMHRVERAMALTSALVGEGKPEFPHIVSNTQDAAFAAAFVRSLKGTGPIVAMHPGTSKFGEFKRWPEGGFAALARSLAGEMRARVFVTWGPSERATAEKVTREAEASCTLSPPTRSLRQLAALIRECDLFVAGDTGPLHIAAALGVPALGIYGPKDPTIYGPYSSKSLVVRLKLPCSPCRKRSCKDARCMKLIRPDTVLGAARRLLHQDKREEKV